jgi:hypothetical protein
MLLQIQNGFLQLESTLKDSSLNFTFAIVLSLKENGHTALLPA